MDGYLELLAGDRYAAKIPGTGSKNDLDSDDYDAKLLQQIALGAACWKF